MNIEIKYYIVTFLNYISCRRKMKWENERIRGGANDKMKEWSNRG